MTSFSSVTERPRYPSDISDARWALIEPVLSAWQAERLARSPVPVQPKYPLREVWNALLYLNRTGVQWQYLPHDFPHFRTVNACYNAWRDEGIFERLNAGMTRLARVREGRAPSPPPRSWTPSRSRRPGASPPPARASTRARRSSAGSGAS